MTLISPNFLVKGFISKCSHILRYWGKGFNIHILEGTQVGPTIVPLSIR